MCADPKFDAALNPYKNERHLAIAVSGGSDSLALLNIAVEWQKQLGDKAPKLYALTVDHGLRKAAADEAHYVSQICQSYGVAHKVLHWRHDDGKMPKAAIAERAREARYGLLAEAALELGATTILLGHTQNDQAETVMMRALHRSDVLTASELYNSSKMGTGFRGLAAMSKEIKHQSGVVYSRPLLAYERETLRNYLCQRSVKWIDDPSNKNLALERPRIRAFLEDNQQNYPIPALSRFADVMSRWRADSATRAAQLISSHVNSDKSKLGVARLDYNFFTAAALPIQFLALRSLLAAIGGQKYLPQVEASQRLLENISQADFKGATLAGTVLTPINNNKDGRYIQLHREYRNITPFTFDSTTKAPWIWDARFYCQYLSEDKTQKIYEIRALGRDGAENLKAENHPLAIQAAKPYFWAAPSIWHEGKLLYIPLALPPFQAATSNMGENWSQAFQIRPYVPAFERFETPLDAPLRKALKSLMTTLYK